MDSGNNELIKSDFFRTIIASSVDGFMILDMNGIIVEANASYCKMMGYARDELLNRHISEIDPLDSEDDVARRSELVMKAGFHRFETQHLQKNGSVIEMEVSSNYSPLYGGTLFSFFRDITSQKRTSKIIAARMRLMEFSLSHTIDELLREVLDEAEALTGSSIAFYHFYDADIQELKLQAWSTQTATHFCKAEGVGTHYPVSRAGVWADSARECRPVIHNDYASLPHRKGMPEGHATVIRELVVPVIRNNEIIALLGIGNKATDYDQRDVETVALLSDHQCF